MKQYDDQKTYPYKRILNIQLHQSLFLITHIFIYNLICFYCQFYQFNVKQHITIIITNSKDKTNQIWTLITPTF